MVGKKGGGFDSETLVDGRRVFCGVVSFLPGCQPRDLFQRMRAPLHPQWYDRGFPEGLVRLVHTNARKTTYLVHVGFLNKLV